MFGFFLDHFLEFFYKPTNGPWWTGAVWSNVIAVSILAPGGYLWSRSRFWPLRPIRHALGGLHRKLDEAHVKLDAHAELHAAHAESLRELHAKLDRVLETQSPPRPPPHTGKAVE